MTNKEAIKILSVLRHTPSVDVFNTLPNTSDSCIEFDYRGALDLAIKALEEKIQKENKVNVICFVDGEEVARFENVNNDITSDFVSLKALLGFGEKNND